MFTDRGIVINVEDASETPGIVVEHYPEFRLENKKYSWHLLEFIKEGAATLAYLIYSINDHLSKSIVSKADLLNYHKELFLVKQSNS